MEEIFFSEWNQGEPTTVALRVKLLLDIGLNSCGPVTAHSRDLRFVSYALFLLLHHQSGYHAHNWRHSTWDDVNPSAIDKAYVCMFQCSSDRVQDLLYVGRAFVSSSTMTFNKKLKTIRPPTDTHTWISISAVNNTVRVKRDWSFTPANQSRPEVLVNLELI